MSYLITLINTCTYHFWAFFFMRGLSSCYGMWNVFWDIVKFIRTTHTAHSEIIQREVGKLKASVFLMAVPFLFHIREL